MNLKSLTQKQLSNKLRYLNKTNPTSRWIPYVKYHLRRYGLKPRLLCKKFKSDILEKTCVRRQIKANWPWPKNIGHDPECKSCKQGQGMLRTRRSTIQDEINLNGIKRYAQGGVT